VLAFDGQVLGGFDDFLASLDPWLREAKGLEAGLLGQAGRTVARLAGMLELLNGSRRRRSVLAAAQQRLPFSAFSLAHDATPCVAEPECQQCFQVSMPPRQATARATAARAARPF
jgi:hypothetical protein